jgi:hypothetical protein
MLNEYTNPSSNLNCCSWYEGTKTVSTERYSQTYAEINKKNVLLSLLTGTSIFPKIAVSTIRTARYGKCVFESYTQNSKTFMNIPYEGFLTTYVTTSTHL